MRRNPDPPLSVRSPTSWSGLLAFGATEARCRRTTSPGAMVAWSGSAEALLRKTLNVTASVTLPMLMSLTTKLSMKSVPPVLITGRARITTP